MNRPHILAALGVAVLTLACQDDQPRRVAAPPDAQRSDSVLSLTVSSLKPDVGSTITVTANVARRASFKPVGSFKAHGPRAVGSAHRTAAPDVRADPWPQRRDAPGKR